MQLNKKRIIIGALWPSFWVAIMLSGIVFSYIDPIIIADILGFHSISSLSAYSFGFFSFWLVCAWSGLFSIIFSRAPRK